MPIQLEKSKFMQFRYEPSYLKNNLYLQSDPIVVCKANNINPQFSKIKIDGGNVVNWTDKAIISERIFDENPKYTDKTKLISEIEELLSVEIIIMPHIKSDMTGHADGMVRFVGPNLLLGNDRSKEYKYWVTGMNKVLKAHNIDYIDIPFFEYKDKKHPETAIGCYVNYLEVKDLIILPIFDKVKNMDKEVYDLFKQIFPDRIIESIEYNKIASDGGILNCTTWTIEQ